MDINVIRLVHPASFQLIDIQNLVADAFESLDGTIDPDQLMGTLTSLVTNPDACILAAQEDMKWKGFVMITPALMFLEPQVFHFYTAGSSKLRKAMIDSVVAWVKERGYNGFWTSNINGEEKDSAFKRLFKRAGPARKMGSIFRFEVT